MLRFGAKTRSLYEMCGLRAVLPFRKEMFRFLGRHVQRDVCRITREMALSRMLGRIVLIRPWRIPYSIVSSGSHCLFGRVIDGEQKLDILLAWKDTVDSLHELHPKVDALLLMKQEVDRMRDFVNTMQESFSFVSSQYDSSMTSIKSQATIIKGLQAETWSLQSIVSEQACDILQLKTNQNNIEQSNRLSNLEMHGIPFSPQHSIMDLLAGLAQQVSIEGFHSAHIVVPHRLPVKSGAVPPVQSRFSCVFIKEHWMGYRGRLGYLPRVDSHPRMYFNVNLTDFCRKLFWMPRTRGKENNFKFV